MWKSKEDMCMKLKKIMTHGIRIITAGIIAFLCLTLFCFVYYNIPVHVTSKIRATDYTWGKYAFYSKMVEGFGYGRMNNEGFNNLENYSGQKVNILLLGSSQMEGTNVPQKETTAALLNTLFNRGKYVYNIGISGHDFPHIINNLETAIKQYSPGEYVFIEIGSVIFSQESLKECINSNVKRIPSYDSKIMFFLQKIPYLRLLYLQYKNFTGNNEEGENVPAQVPIQFNREEYSRILDGVMKKVHQISMYNNIKTIIFYHPHLTLNKDGSALVSTNDEYLAIFENACRDNGIYFIDMTDVFLKEYKKNHILPHGFANTAIGTGHLNKNGHRLIADALFYRINEIKKDGSI
jgi:hypothetical protein